MFFEDAHEFPVEWVAQCKRSAVVIRQWQDEIRFTEGWWQHSECDPFWSDLGCVGHLEKFSNPFGDLFFTYAQFGGQGVQIARIE